jgi:hypothetical protein
MTIIMVLWSAMPLVSAYQTTFYFHNHSQPSISVSPFKLGSFQIPAINASPDSPSARAFAEPTPTPPTGPGTSLDLTGLILIQGAASAYAGLAGWIMKPFSTEVSVTGDVIMHVWMSSQDSLLPWEVSVWFVGVADYRPGSPAQVLAINVTKPTLGSALSVSAAEYEGKMHINPHTFQPGSTILLFSGAASTRQGWKFTIDFDSPSHNSRAELPVDATLTIPEFRNITPILLAAGLIALISKRKLQVSCSV